jgi:hypothetical protein
MLQLAMPQTGGLLMVLHEGVPFIVVHTLPQAPQLLTSVPVLVSQLVPGLPGQWA